MTAKLDRSGYRRSSDFKDPSATNAVIGGLLERAASASIYETFHAGESKRWLAHLREREKGPTDEQFAVLEDICARCIFEADEEQRDCINRRDRERLRMMIQGLPGAGKSQVIHWIRAFFTEVLRWTPGNEYVCIASMNSMAALIGGSTIHSFGHIPISKKAQDAKKAS